MIIKIIGYIGMIFIISGFFLISDNKKKLRLIGFIINIVGCGIMLTQAAMLNLLSIVLLNLFMIIMSLKGIVNIYKSK